MTPAQRRTWIVVLASVYAAALLVSNAVRSMRERQAAERPLASGEHMLTLAAIDGGAATSGTIRLVYDDSDPSGADGRPAPADR